MSAVLKAKVYAIFNNYEFDWRKRRDSIIWAAKHKECPKCKAEAYKACRNLADVRASRIDIRDNKWPHEERIDFELLFNKLIERGYRLGNQV